MRKKHDALDNAIRKWEEECEDNNHHSQYGQAEYLSKVLLKYVSRNIASKIIRDGLVLGD